MTEKAPWAERDNFQGEVTKDGLMVFTAGYNTREALNDGQHTHTARQLTVTTRWGCTTQWLYLIIHPLCCLSRVAVWVTADGGYTWGQCVAEASFSDRRWQTTILDNQGYFLLIGGEEMEGGVSTKLNGTNTHSFP